MSETEETEGLLERGEISLAFGLIMLGLSLALTHFVMGFFLAVIPFGLACTLLPTGLLRSRNPDASPGKLVSGFFLLVVAFCVQIVSGFFACRLSYAFALNQIRPSAPVPDPTDIALAFLTWLLPIILFWPGFRFWTDWSISRRITWVVLTALFPVMVIVLHQMLASWGGPLTA